MSLGEDTHPSNHISPEIKLDDELDEEEVEA